VTTLTLDERPSNLRLERGADLKLSALSVVSVRRSRPSIFFRCDVPTPQRLPQDRYTSERDRQGINTAHQRAGEGEGPEDQL
jgi:hypothetical protein